MASETDFLNDALGQIGQTIITAIDDGSVNANYCQRFWPPLRDAMIRSNHWNFAKTRAALVASVTPPLFDYAFSYPLPSDPWCLKVIEYNGTQFDSTHLTLYDFQMGMMVDQFKIEGRNLLTNDGVVQIMYLARITNPDQWDAMFYQCACAWLASKLAKAIPKDTKRSMALFEEAQKLWDQATAVDGQEGSVEAQLVDNLLWGR